MEHLDDASLVQGYLECFDEIVRLGAGGQDVPDSLWARLRDGWAAMTPADRERVERRTRTRPK